MHSASRPQSASSATLVSILAALFAVQQRNTAEEQRNIAENRLQMAVARDLAAQATIVQQQQGRLLPRSLLLAVESLRRSPTLQATMALTSGLRLFSSTNPTLVHDQGSDSIDFSPDGELVASGGENGTARIWHVADGKEILRCSSWPQRFHRGLQSRRQIPRLGRRIRWHRQGVGGGERGRGVEHRPRRPTRGTDLQPGRQDCCLRRQVTT